MKLGPLTDLTRYANQVHEKKDTGGSGQQSGQQKHPNQDQNSEKSETFHVSDENVGVAIDAFKQDTHAQANGLDAEMTGKGPGLRVTLKDGSGAIVRQFTGEEFLKLREAVSGLKRGKILDQKI